MGSPAHPERPPCSPLFTVLASWMQSGTLSLAGVGLLINQQNKRIDDSREDVKDMQAGQSRREAKVDRLLESLLPPIPANPLTSRTPFAAWTGDQALAGDGEHRFPRRPRLRPALLQFSLEFAKPLVPPGFKLVKPRKGQPVKR